MPRVKGTVKTKASISNICLDMYCIICEGGYKAFIDIDKLKYVSVGDSGVVTWATDGKSLGFPTFKKE